MTVRTDCLKCDGWGCRACKDDPGEQGLSLDEKEMLQLRARLRDLEAALRGVHGESSRLVTLDGAAGRFGDHLTMTRTLVRIRDTAAAALEGR
jgi:hypothetical protein